MPDQKTDYLFYLFSLNKIYEKEKWNKNIEILETKFNRRHLSQEFRHEPKIILDLLPYHQFVRLNNDINYHLPSPKLAGLDIKFPEDF